MRIFLVFIFVVLLGQQAFAHGSHRPPVTQDEALTIAVKISRGFAGADPQLGFGALPETWMLVGKGNASVHQQGEGYWIIKVLNQNEGQTLYILMSEEGEVFDANLTGKFPGLE